MAKDKELKTNKQKILSHPFLKLQIAKDKIDTIFLKIEIPGEKNKQQQKQTKKNTLQRKTQLLLYLFVAVQACLTLKYCLRKKKAESGFMN